MIHRRPNGDLMEGYMGIFAELPVRLRDVEDFMRGQMILGRLM